MRNFTDFPLQVKALTKREFEGYGSIFGNVDLGGDVVERGAFRRSLDQYRKKGTLPPMFWMHKPDNVAGKWLDMQEDDKGLHVKGVLAETPLGDEMHALLKLDAVRGLSIGYFPVEREYAEDGTRFLKDVDLWEVSLVSLAMNPLAQIEAVKARLSATGEYVPSKREFEHILRDAGCTIKTAKFMVTKLYDGPASATDAARLRDAGGVDALSIIERMKKCAETLRA